MGELWPVPPVPGWSSFFNLLTLTSSGLIHHNDSMDRLIPRGFLHFNRADVQIPKYTWDLRARKCSTLEVGGEARRWQMCGGGCSLSLWHDTSPLCVRGCLASITEYLVSGGDQIIALFFIPSPPPPSPRTQQPIISKSGGIFANLILIFQIFLLTNEQGLRHLVSINTLTSTHITSARQINPKIMFLSTA